VLSACARNVDDHCAHARAARAKRRLPAAGTARTHDTTFAERVGGARRSGDGARRQTVTASRDARCAT